MTWITGEKILERPDWGLKAELAKAFKAGLRPYREADGAMLTARIERDGKALDMGSRCFHCVHGSEDRGYMATGCPRSDAGQNIDMIIRKIVKPGIEELRGKVDKALFRDGLPSNVFDFPGYSADADFVQFVEGKVGPENLRAMLIESRCSRQELASSAEMCKRLLAAKFRLKDVEEYESATKSTSVEKKQAIAVLSVIPGTTWSQIRIRIAKRNRIEIWREGYEMHDFNLAELGLSKARSKMAILKEFGRGKKKLKRGLPVASSQNICNLKKHIKSIFPGVEGDPIVTEDEMYKKNYVCQFEIDVSEEVYSEEYYTRDEVQDDNEDWEELIKNNR